MENVQYISGGSTDEAAAAPEATGLGNNPSTWAGAIVIGALVVLLAARKSFARYM